MFKRIVKVSGIVLLGFVLLIGGVVAFLAIRGDFKKKVVRPTSIDFSIKKTDLVFDAHWIGQENLVNEQIFSFTITAQPADVTVRECKLKVINSNLIEFGRLDENGNWKVYNSSTFYLNTPIYFKLKNVTDEMVDTYYDGVVQIQVQDKMNSLYKELELKIDRATTSISILDRDNPNNNQIINGLFTYESDKYNGVVEQNLEVIVAEDYPLEIITAPHKSLKPFSGEDAKVYEMYYIDQDQPYALMVMEDNNVENRYKEVMLGIANKDTGLPEAKLPCGFLKYDSIEGRYVFNSLDSGDYKFKLMTYPTYAIQEEIIAENKSFFEVLSDERVLTKIVNIKVTGSDANGIRFDGDNTSLGLNLFQDNEWCVKI